MVSDNSDSSFNEEDDGNGLNSSGDCPSINS